MQKVQELQQEGPVERVSQAVGEGGVGVEDGDEDEDHAWPNQLISSLMTLLQVRDVEVIRRGFSVHTRNVL